MLPAEDLFVYVYVLIDDLAAADHRDPAPPRRGAGLQRRRAARHRAGSSVTAADAGPC